MKGFGLNTGYLFKKAKFLPNITHNKYIVLHKNIDPTTILPLSKHVI